MRISPAPRRLLYALALFTLMLATPLRLDGRSPGQNAPGPALRIVVIEGEGAVNIVQQKAATAPVVEVRDRNNQPVAGAIVRFAIQGGRASFGGGQVLSVTTNVAGRAAVTGLTPTASGTLQIGVSAAFQGQTATATIAQVNVMTAAQAATVTSASVAGTGGTAGAGAGGLSATTIGIVSGAVAGGTFLAKETLFADGIPGRFVSPFAFVVQERKQINNPPSVCFTQVSVAGTIVIDDSHLSIDWVETPTTTTCSALGSPTDVAGINNDVIGPPDKLTYDRTVNFQEQNGTGTIIIHFEGALNDAADTITGALTISRSFTTSFSVDSYGPVATPVTLTKQ